MFLNGGETILRPQHPRGDKWRTRIARFAERARLCEIFAERRGGVGVETRETPDAGLCFRSLRCFIAFQIVQPTSRMGVDDGETFFLFLQMLDDRNERQMLNDIGEISGVIGVAVIHFLIRRGRC